MGEKSRGNWLVSVCLRYDCLNRGEKCDACVKFSEYEPKKPKYQEPYLYQNQGLNPSQVSNRGLNQYPY